MLWSMDLSDVVTLGGAYDEDGASPVNLQSLRDLLKWTAYLLHQRRRRLFVLKAEVAVERRCNVRVCLN